MKKILVSILKAFLYTGVFLGVQLAVTVVVTLFFALLGDIMIYSLQIYDADSILNANLLPTVTILSGWITLLFFWLFFAVRGKRFSAEVRWHKMPSAGSAMLGPLECGFGLSILASCALAMIPFPDAWYDTYDASMEMLLSGNPLFLAAATVIAAPLVEEVVFRGLVYTRLCRGMWRWAAALISALIFGLVHGTLLHLFYTIPMGLLLCLFYEKYRSLWAPIILHMSFNLAGTVLEYYAGASAVVIVLLLLVGLFLTVLGFLSMYWYRRDNGLCQKPIPCESPDLCQEPLTAAEDCDPPVQSQLENNNLEE